MTTAVLLPADDLAARLARSLYCKAGARMNDVVVSVDESCIVIHGRIASRYILRLALMSVREALSDVGECVSRIELVTDHLTRKGAFHAVCTRPNAGRREGGTADSHLW